MHQTTRIFIAIIPKRINHFLPQLLPDDSWQFLSTLARIPASSKPTQCKAHLQLQPKSKCGLSTSKIFDAQCGLEHWIFFWSSITSRQTFGGNNLIALSYWPLKLLYKVTWYGDRAFWKLQNPSYHITPWPPALLDYEEYVMLIISTSHLTRPENLIKPKPLAYQCDRWGTGRHGLF